MDIPNFFVRDFENRGRLALEGEDRAFWFTPTLNGHVLFSFSFFFTLNEFNVSSV